MLRKEFAGVGDVLLHGGSGRICIPLNNCGQHGSVILCRRCRPARNLVVKTPGDVPGKNAKDPAKSRGASDHVDRSVKLVVLPLQELRVIAMRGCHELKMEGLKLGNLLGSCCQSSARGELTCDQCMPTVEVTNIVADEQSDGETSSGNKFQESLDAQSVQGFPNWSSRYGKGISEVFNTNRFPWLQLTGHYGLAHIFCNLFA